MWLECHVGDKHLSWSATGVHRAQRVRMQKNKVLYFRNCYCLTKRGMGRLPNGIAMANSSEVWYNAVLR